MLNQAQTSNGTDASSAEPAASVPPKRWRVGPAALFERAALAAVVLGLLGLGVVMIAPMPFGSATNSHPEDTLGYVAIYAATLCVIFMIVWFIVAFTQRMTVKKGDKRAEEREVMPLVRYAYAFTVFALFAAIAPAFLGKPITDLNLGTGIPIQIVNGCVSTETDWELACDDQCEMCKTQWFVSIGGSSEMVRLPNCNPSSAGSARTECSRFKVSGGMAVPWYVLSVALFGATVSLARRIPELQWKALDDSDMTGPQMRDHLVFEIFQVLTAPLIAAAAYNILSPTTPAQSTALAFASGFSSQLILMSIRGFADRLLQAQGSSVSVAAVAAPKISGITTGTSETTEPPPGAAIGAVVRANNQDGHQSSLDSGPVKAP